MPFCCPVVSLYSAVTRAILAYDCNDTYCSILELFVHCNITIFTVVQRSFCLCVFFFLLFAMQTYSNLCQSRGYSNMLYMQLAMLQVVTVFQVIVLWERAYAIVIAAVTFG